jgi:hypothetical protein
MYFETTEPQLFNMAIHSDERGHLSSLDFSVIPFEVKRIFNIQGNGLGTVRGGHAHKQCWQFLYSNGPGIKVDFQNLKSEGTFYLDFGAGLIVPPYNWIEVTFPDGTITVSVLASHSYDINDYLYSKPGS